MAEPRQATCPDAVFAARRDRSAAELAALDHRCLWHPFTQMQDWLRREPLIIERGDGVRLTDVHGRVYYDGVSSIWLSVHGHCVPEINAAIEAQLARIAHSTMLGASNVPAILLAEQLVELSPPGLTRVFYSDSGSSAVEIALKIAYQFWHHQGQTERRLFLKMAEAYHGDTIGSVSVGGMDLFHATYRDLLFPTLAVPFPHAYRFDGSAAACSAHCLAVLEELLVGRASEIVALVLEPIVQGAAGMRIMPQGFLAAAAALCRRYDVLLIADEVATGFGRTGRMFAGEHEDLQPDIMTVAKGLTGGYLPLAATLTSERIFAAFLGDYAEQKTFFHGHSYTGNQLGCAAALANLQLFRERDLLQHICRQSDRVAAALRPLIDCPHVGDVRGAGLMWGIELIADKAAGTDYPWAEQMGVKVCNHSRELGMILRPLGNVVVFMPPLSSTAAELDEMLSILRQAIVAVTECAASS